MFESLVVTYLHAERGTDSDHISMLSSLLRVCHRDWLDVSKVLPFKIATSDAQCSHRVVWHLSEDPLVASAAGHHRDVGYGRRNMLPDEWASASMAS
eukprot:4125147-Amphidinium_carterae.2